jgi:hypothetical protein
MNIALLALSFFSGAGLTVAFTLRWVRVGPKD